MFASNLLMPSGSEGDPDPLVMVGLDFTGGDLRRLPMDGIDLGQAWLEAVDFTGASLKEATIGFCPRAVFRDANLTDATFCGDIGGTDFTGARMEGVHVDSAFYELGSPPGLQPELLLQCREMPKEASEAACSPVGRPVACRARLILTKARR